jgi:hypothetical protein
MYNVEFLLMWNEYVYLSQCSEYLDVNPPMRGLEYNQLKEYTVISLTLKMIQNKPNILWHIESFYFVLIFLPFIFYCILMAVDGNVVARQPTTSGTVNSIWIQRWLLRRRKGGRWKGPNRYNGVIVVQYSCGSIKSVSLLWEAATGQGSASS